MLFCVTACCAYIYVGRESVEIVAENSDSFVGKVLVPSKSLSGFARGYALDIQLIKL